MKYPKITGLVPQNESFDESAVNEGVWLSEPHLTSIEKGLTDAILSNATTTAALETANASLATATEELNSIKAESQASKTTIATQAARILELEAEVAALGQKPSGSGSAVKTNADGSPEGEKKPSYASDSNPANAWIDNQLSRRKKTA